MQLAFITPTAYLESHSAQGDFYLALAHLIDDEGKNDYAQFHLKQSKRGKRVYLDNGLFEGSQVSTRELLSRAAAIQAHVVCAPDVLYDAKGTIKSFKQFVRAKQDAGLVAQVMGIPQADNEHDWWDCFHYMNSVDDNCDMIGLSILSIPASFKRKLSDFLQKKMPLTMSRVYLIEQLYSYACLIDDHIKPCHLLGLGESYADIFMANRLLPHQIVSNDSSSAFVHGMAGVRYSPLGHIPGGKITEKLDFETKLAGLMTIEGQARHHLTMATIQENIDMAHRFKKRRAR